MVLAVDIDNDLYRRTKITGPVIGRNDNLKAAARLALADPQDPDANTMFEAVRKYDQLKRAGNHVAVVTVTGAEKEGYAADSELARQLDIALDKFKADSCVLVTDGASDERVLPMLKTRVKVNSVDLVRMKQAAELENTYFTILEKLKEPHYARIVFGIPAILLLLFALSYWFNFGWQLPVALVGLYLVAKGFGLEDALVDSFRGFGFSIYRMSFVFYVGALIFAIIAVVVGFGLYAQAMSQHLASDGLTLAAYWLEGFLIIIPISMVLYLIGKVTDLESRRQHYRAIAQGTYVGYGVASIVLFYLAAAWIIGQIYFWQFLVYSAVTLVGGYAVASFSAILRKEAVRNKKIKNKQVVNDIGAYVGKIVDVDAKRGVMMIKTDYGSTLRFDIDRITNISDRVVIR